MNNNKLIAIDFDGVIVEKDSFPMKVIPKSFNALKTLIKSGYSVYIFTARKPKEVYDFLYKSVTGGLDFEIIPDSYTFYDKLNIIGISNKKFPAILYLDDNAIRFTGNWDTTMNMINDII